MTFSLGGIQVWMPQFLYSERHYTLEAANLFLILALKAKSSEVMTQMQQVIQGTVALASLSQAENPDLMQLAQSVKVSGDDKMVTVGVEFPVEKAIRLLGEQKAKSRGDESGASKKKDN